MRKWTLFLLPLILALAAAPVTAEEEEAPYSGFIKKGAMTGNIDKLMNVNLFVAGRFNQLDNNGLNDAYMIDDADSISVPGARLYLTGQVYTDIFYKVAYEFSNENDFNTADRNGRLTDAMLTWKIPLSESWDLIDALDFNIGLGPIFLSPAGEEDIFFLDTIQHPLIVQNILPPGIARDEGLYFRGSFFDSDTLQVWAGMYNGAHRRVGSAAVPISAALDAWGSSPGGDDVDQFAYMSRAELNILNEEDFFFMVSGGVSTNSVLDQVNSRRVDDTLYDLATEYRFNNRNTWIKGELIRTRTHHTDDMYGFHVTGGHLLEFITDHLEVVARYERQRLDDHCSSVDDLWAATLGVNYFFDPEHQNDAKMQLNYVVKKAAQTDLGKPFHGDNAILFQFVLGF